MKLLCGGKGCSAATACPHKGRAAWVTAPAALVFPAPFPKFFTNGCKILDLGQQENTIIYSEANRFFASEIISFDTKKNIFPQSAFFSSIVPRNMSSKFKKKTVYTNGNHDPAYI